MGDPLISEIIEVECDKPMLNLIPINISKDKLAVGTGLDRHCHCQHCSEIAQSVRPFKSVVRLLHI